ncbi:hypothetical protein [Trichothermofontia sp.]
MKDIWAGIAARRLLPFLCVVMLGLSFGLTGCQEAAIPVGLPVASQPSPVKLAGRLSEVAPPAAIQSLRQSLDVYQPQVAIVSPRPNEVLSSTTVNVRFQVRDLPLFEDESLGLGPHLHVVLDNQPYQTVYDLEQPLVFKDLEPGTHTLRAFAVRPWDESFKNDGAYAQVTFHVLTQTATNHPDPKLPVLTYSSPQGRYGAEPILLDFYLANAPLQLAAAADSPNDLSDWRIRVTINGESFVLDNWQPVYLKGFKRGDNWLKLEFLNDRGELVLNAFNNPTRLIQYEPGGKDTLSRLMRGELSASAAQGIVKPTLTPPAQKPAAPVPSQPATQPTPATAPKPIASPPPRPSSVAPTASPPAPTEVNLAPEVNPTPVVSPPVTPPAASPLEATAPSRGPAAADLSPIETVSPRPVTAPRGLPAAPTPKVTPAPLPTVPTVEGTGPSPTPETPEVPRMAPALDAAPPIQASPTPTADRSSAPPTPAATPSLSPVSPSAVDTTRLSPTVTSEETSTAAVSPSQPPAPLP